MEKSKNKVAPYFTKIRETVDYFFGSYYFTVFFALAMFLCWEFEASLLGISVVFCSIIAILLTQRSLEGLVSVFILFPLFVYDSNYFMVLDFVKMSYLLIYSTFTLIAIVLHFVVLHERTTKNFFASRFTIPFILATIALTIGGIGYPNHTLLHSLLGFGFGFLCFIVYYLVLRCTTKDIKKLTSFALFLFGVVAVIQVFVMLGRAEDFAGLVMSKELNVGWANVNNIAIALAATIPFALYLSFDNKVFAWVYYVFVFVALGVLVITQSRGVILITLLLFPIAWVFTLVKARVTSKIELVMVSLAAIAVTCSLFYLFELDFLFSQFSRLGIGDNGRMRDWQFFWNKFKESPIFGVGFFGFDGDFHENSINKVHNTLLQFLTCTGVFGTLLMFPIFYQKYKLTIYKFSRFKFLTLISFLFVGLYGMIDVTILNGYLTISRIILFVALEQETKLVIERKGGKNRGEKSMYNKFIKRMFDFVLALFAIIVLSPVMAIVAIFVRIKLGSPVVFKQYRPGKDNKIFKFYKFRSMTDERDENGELKPDEVRLTKFGKLLRKTSLDELPQLFNILKGDMSFVGPRPKLIKDMIFYNADQNKRSEVRPGLTGYAQANGRNLNTWAETFEYDKHYVEHISLWLDIKILWKTFLKVVKRAEIVTQDQVPDSYYFGDHLLKTNQITKEEYDEKMKQAKMLESVAGKRKTA